MSHASKSKAKGISASSFFDLKAEISKQEEEFARNRTIGKCTARGVKRADKKPTVWSRQNKGVNSRAARDCELEEISKPTLESARAALERKAKIYDKLKKGKSGGLSDKQYEALLVDFNSKGPSEFFESDSDDVDESITIPRPPTNAEGNPIIEYEDEFGRMRTARRSEVPRDLLPRSEDEHDEDEDIVIRNPVNHFPIYEPSAERVAEVAKALAEQENPLHYDASKEVRAKGAGFYQFSADEETRRAQMEELKSSREETERIRLETGAVDVRPGEVEGMIDGGESGPSARSRAMEKRKNELEERRKLLNVKRRKTNSGAVEKTTSPKPASVDSPASREPMTRPPSRSPPDPFAALEAKNVYIITPAIQPAIPAPMATEADTFLSQLEQDFLRSKIKKTH
ncbi:hypothetical protein BDQ17DRAFT_1253506 [Cyathus striatus]|nr:hypothetical protein BDQ17DRAFT_1253506 [Cyathus striatus]